MHHRRSTRSALLGLTAGALLVAGAVTASPAAAADGPACDAATVAIGAVQGSGDAGPLAGQVVTVAGTVVGDLQDGGFDGVFVQDAGDGDPATSDGVFVHRAPGELAPGDRVVVRGTVAEFNGLTELTDVALSGCGSAEPPAPALLPLPSTPAQREALEGMLVAPPADLTVSDVHDLDRYGQLLLSAGGRLVTPTEVADPGPAAAALAEENARRSVLLDDGRTADLSRSADALPYLTRTDPVRVGDTARLQPQVLSYAFGGYVLEPADGSAAGTTFAATNPRPAAAPEVGGDLRVADFNVLNYFVTTGGQSRGAQTAAELAQQQAKTVSALTALHADLVTLHEIENSAVTTPATPYRAVGTLVAALEAADGHAWAYVEAHEDTDVITNAIVYRTDRVTAVGEPRVPADLTAFGNARSPVAQTFRAGDETFTVIANHLKSKGGSGATGDNADTGSGAGAYNGDRVRQARALVDFAAAVARDTGDPDVLLTGDFNSYAEEDPIDVVTAAGFTDLGPVLAPGRYSYVFDGGSGSLDHALASASLAGKVTGLDVWDVDAVESAAYQYDGREELYTPDPYRASDHDPIVLGLRTDVPATATISTATPLRGDQVGVTGTGFAAGEKVTVSLPARNGRLGSAVADGSGTVHVTFRVPVGLPAGAHDVELTGSSGETAPTGFRLRTVLAELVTRLVGLLSGR
ncbi:ExeM/NucH family extracellular endonuclease [Modestobacter sp. NPDC049651]|uniref:ExeM/NucH family extracellular endonuclease n=1 Tax=unclassified Modestobacter TaxID=2643866 RepID=UPI0033D04F45